ncbi:2Fe-2S iron-sulfur cluster-binding protein [Halomontanus rarus]|uniref:2Fe-2S iron-sulfur cluster-binding protein n=1 Tax=Halomontanus rarus TaxID=3034020 RepID=UPI0023E86AFE|nr:2Fe-2S iron-sulfur cluster-binding protein [Halovivax sp. TS33]
MRVEIVRAADRASKSQSQGGIAIAVEPGEILLDAAERAGVPIPFGCRTGACSTCTGKLRSGEIEHVRAPRALKERHLRTGYVLTCIATPTTDCRLEVGPDVQAELLENPWK